MSFAVYIVKCRDGSYYTGHTDDLDRRIAEHQAGQIEGYTHKRRPVELMWSESLSERIDALEAEKRIKGWSRAKKEALFAGDWERISELARKPRGSVLRYAAPTRSAATHDKRGESGADAGRILQAPQYPFALSSENEPEPVEGRARVSKGSRVLRYGPSGPTQDERGGGNRPREQTLQASRNPLAQHSRIEPQPVEDRRRVSKGHSPSRPVIVLVRPQLGENIGKAARAMLNFGLDELRLVAPRDGWPNPDAGPAAAGADAVLAEAQVYDSLADAVSDCANVYATTVRKRGVTKPVVTPAEAAAELRTLPGRSAIVFGPERSGLETDDVALARAIVTVPINPEFGSLNLAQAVIVCAYEWSKGETLASPPHEDLLPPAPQSELDGLIGALETLLEPTGYFDPPDRTVSTRRTLRTLLTKPAWNSLEVRTLRGVVSALRKGDRRD